MQNTTPFLVGLVTQHIFVFHGNNRAQRLPFVDRGIANKYLEITLTLMNYCALLSSGPVPYPKTFGDKSIFSQAP